MNDYEVGEANKKGGCFSAIKYDAVMPRISFHLSEDVHVEETLLEKGKVEKLNEASKFGVNKMVKELIYLED